jgi:hypothetical protein
VVSLGQALTVVYVYYSIVVLLLNQLAEAAQGGAMMVLTLQQVAPFKAVLRKKTMWY